MPVETNDLRAPNYGQDHVGRTVVGNRVNQDVSDHLPGPSEVVSPVRAGHRKHSKVAEVVALWINFDLAGYHCAIGKWAFQRPCAGKPALRRIALAAAANGYGDQRE